MKRFLKLGIGVKLTIIVSLLFTFALGILGAISFQSSSKAIKNTINLALKNRAADTSMLVESNLHGNIAHVEEIAQRPEVYSGNWEVQKSFLISQLNRMGNQRFQIIDRNGQAQSTNGTTADLASREYFKKALSGVPAVSEPIISNIDKTVVVVIAAPIKTPQGNILGVLSATFDGALLNKTIENIKVGSSGKGYAFMINKEGAVIAHPNKELVLIQDNDFENVKKDSSLQGLVDIKRKMVSGQNDSTTYRHGGEELFMSYAPVNGTDWSIALTAPKSDYFKEIDTLQWKTILITILFILLGIFLCYFACKRMITKPINTLVEISDQLSTGNVDVNIQATGQDEIGRLMGSFSQMIENIKEQAHTAERIAAGELNIDISQRSEKDVLSKSMKTVIQVLNDLIKETDMLNNAAQEGRLTTRGDSKRFLGGYASVIEGINNTLDNVIKPIEEAGEVLGKMSQNDFTLKIEGQYKGMLGEFADKINTVRNRLLSVQDALVRVAQGDFSRLEEFQKIKKRSENDHLMPSVTGMMSTILELSKETGRVSEAVVNGNLSLRGDVDKFHGEYRQVITGLNQALDAIMTPLNEYADIFHEMSKGNLSVYAKGQYNGEYERIKEAINHTLVSFNEVLSDINKAAEQVSTGAVQVSHSSMALSQGATEQASTIEQLTASIDEVASQTRLNAANANQSKDMADIASKNAALGNERMQTMLSAINDINNSSSDISRIIKVIDEIAFQTNILALNAAVEAARAGQYGKGFAVVAEEVRNLAARSANAAKETTVLIENSIKKAEEGTKIAQATAEALDLIIGSIEKSAGFIGEIAIASNEQANAVAQINMGVNQVSQVIQTNSATSEEGAAASEELSSQAELLKEMVKKFKLAGSFGDIEKHKATDRRRDNKTFVLLSDHEFGKY